jgi:hypothetical protein
VFREDHGPPLHSTSMSHLEPSLEALLVRVVPGLAESWAGAGEREIAELQAIAGRPLPDFYLWFLARMGRSMGPMRYPTVDFTAQGVLSAYASRAIEPDGRFLLLGHERDELTPLHYFYDLDQPARGDALVVRMLTPRDERHEQFETLREMLAWGELWAQRVEGAAQHCRGTLRASGGAVYPVLAAALTRLGFTAPIETGSFCGLYERADATLVCSGTPGEPREAQAFGLGGRDAATLGQLLGELTREAGVEVTLSAWSPPLPGPS